MSVNNLKKKIDLSRLQTNVVWDFLSSGELTYLVNKFYEELTKFHQFVGVIGIEDGFRSKCQYIDHWLNTYTYCSFTESFNKLIFTLFREFNN